MWVCTKKEGLEKKDGNGMRERTVRLLADVDDPKYLSLPPEIASTKSIRSSRSPTVLSDRVTVHLDKVSACCLFEEGRWDPHRVLEHAT